MTTQISHYLNGMISWGELRRAAQIWVWINKPAFCPAGAALAFQAQ